MDRRTTHAPRPTIGRRAGEHARTEPGDRVAVRPLIPNPGGAMAAPAPVARETPEAGPISWPDERLLRVRDVADLLALSPRTVWRMATTGDLPAPIRLGGSTRWRWGDLRALVCGR